MKRISFPIHFPSPAPPAPAPAPASAIFLLARGNVSGEPCCCCCWCWCCGNGDVFPEELPLAGGGGVAAAAADDPATAPQSEEDEEEVDDALLGATGATNDPPLAKYVRFEFAPAEDARLVLPGGVLITGWERAMGESRGDDRTTPAPTVMRLLRDASLLTCGDLERFSQALLRCCCA